MATPLPARGPGGTVPSLADHPRHLGLLPRLRGVPAARRGDRRRRPGGALQPGEARHRFPEHAVRACLARGRHRRSTTSTASPSTTSRSSSSSASSRLTSPSLRAGLAAFVQAIPVVAGREALDAGPDRPRRSGYRRARSSSPSTTSRTPPPRSSPRRSHEAAILTMDGVGEWATTSWGVGQGNRVRADRRASLPALARAALLGLHLLLRLQGELRRVQADGARPVRRAPLRPGHPRAPPRREGGRLVPDEPRLLRLRRWAAHDLASASTSCSAARRASPRRRSPSGRWTWRAPSRTSPRRSCSGWPATCGRRPGSATSVWPAAWP